jgi:diguanylate cyclase (GGDEF)-like protein
MREMVLLMERQITDVTFSLSGPATLSAFAVIFFILYLRHKHHQHLLIFAVTSGFFSLGMISQIMDGLNAVYTGLPANISYMIAALLFCIGLAKRIGQRPPYLIILPVLSVIALQTWYFTDIAPNQLARIYLLNFSAGIILILAALSYAPQRHGLFTEKLLFWALLLFGFHFFPRTILTAGYGLQVEPDVFLISPYWVVLQLSLAALGAAVAIAVLCACIYDTVAATTEDPDIDRLTRVLSRRAFHGRAEQTLRDTAGQVSCLALFDIDNFRRFNQRAGYEEGDRVLAEFGTVLACGIPRENLTGRYDGEEFLILLPRTKLATAVETLQDFMATLRNHKFSADDTLAPMTISLGLVEIGANETYAQALSRAQLALKSAEAQGGDKLIAGSPPKDQQKEGPASNGALQT